ncbi:MAG: hypothetical protein JJU33_08565 [Phycisphaerales bacterium]|nr:hypothetical protein [Phycisphaerales bacterium]
MAERHGDQSESGCAQQAARFLIVLLFLGLFLVAVVMFGPNPTTLTEVNIATGEQRNRLYIAGLAVHSAALPPVLTTTRWPENTLEEQWVAIHSRPHIRKHRGSPRGPWQTTIRQTLRAESAMLRYGVPEAYRQRFMRDLLDGEPGAYLVGIRRDGAGGAVYAELLDTRDRNRDIDIVRIWPD